MATSTQALVAAIDARLQAALPALLAAAGLPAILEFLDYDPAIPQPAKAPQVWIDVPNETRSDDERRGATLGKYATNRVVYVTVTAAGPDPSTAAKQLRGTADMIRQCLEGDQTAGETSLWVRWTRTDYSPNFAQGSNLYKEACLTFDVPKRTQIGTD